jgi:hypothetical protein
MTPQSQPNGRRRPRGLTSTAGADGYVARPRGVGVTCLYPGPVRTGIVDQITAVGTPQPIQTPTLALIEAAEVGRLVVDAFTSAQIAKLVTP